MHPDEREASFARCGSTTAARNRGSGVTEQQGLFIGGRWSSPSTDEVLEVVSPHTEAVIARPAAAGPQDVDRAVAMARAPFDDGPWPRLDPSERIDAVRRLAARYDERRKDMAQLITSEMGAPISFSRFAQATLPIMLMHAFADVADGYAWEERRPGPFGEDILVAHEPVGVVAAIVPWNMPQFLIVGKLVPALLAGCSVVLKPAPETPLDANLMAEICAAAELPDGVLSVLPGDAETGADLVAHPGVDKVSFTG